MIHHRPSSRFVPAIKGRRANCPLASSFDGKSGSTPPGPSIVGSKGTMPGASERAASRPWAMSVEFAPCRQGKVSPLLARETHEGTLLTKFLQSYSRSSALELRVVEAEPDSKI